MSTSRQQDLIRAIREHGLHERSTALANLLEAAETGVLSDQLCVGWLQQLQGAIREQRVRPNLLSKPPDEEQLYADGRPDIELGTLSDTDGLRFGINFKSRPRHLLAVGSTGSGKTTALRQDIERTYRLARAEGLRVCMLVFERKGPDYTNLTNLGPEWVRLVANDGLRVGMNGPSSVPPSAWINQVSTIFAARSGLIAAATSFNALLRWLLPILNPDPGPTLRWPSFRLLAEVTNRLPDEAVSAKAPYTQSLRQALEAVVQASDVFDTFNGLDLERDIIAARRHAVIDLSTLAPPVARLIVTDLLLSQLLLGRAHAHHAVDTTEVSVYMDESDADLAQVNESRFADGMSPLGQSLKQGREFGLRFALSASFLGGASQLILNNIQDHLVFNLSDETSIAEARRTLLLHPSAAAILPGLRPGECVVRQAQAAYPHAMLGKIDPLPPYRGGGGRVDHHAFLPTLGLDALSDVQEAVKERQATFLRSRRRQKQAGRVEINKDARHLLSLAELYPGTPVARLWEKRDKPPAAAQQIAVRKALEAEPKLANFEEVRVGKRNLLLIEVTKAGAELLGAVYRPLPGRGGLAHRTYAAWLMIRAQQRQITARRELVVPSTNHPVDVAYEVSPGGWHAFEIIGSDSGVDTILPHLHACLLESTAISHVTIVVPLKKTQEAILQLISADPRLAGVRARIDFLSVVQLHDELWPLEDGH